MAQPAFAENRGVIRVVFVIIAVILAVLALFAANDNGVNAIRELAGGEILLGVALII